MKTITIQYKMTDCYKLTYSTPCVIYETVISFWPEVIRIQDYSYDFGYIIVHTLRGNVVLRPKRVKIPEVPYPTKASRVRVEIEKYYKN
jgi:hypothetical protein